MIYYLQISFLLVYLIWKSKTNSDSDIKSKLDSYRLSNSFRDLLDVTTCDNKYRNSFVSQP